MVDEGKWFRLGKSGKVIAVVSRRETEERVGRRPAFTIDVLVQTKPIGQVFEAGRIDWLPPDYDIGGVVQDLHWHQRVRRQEGGEAIPITNRMDTISAIREKLTQSREWIVDGGFDVDDDLTDDAEFDEFIDRCMAELCKLVRQKKG